MKLQHKLALFTSRNWFSIVFRGWLAIGMSLQLSVACAEPGITPHSILIGQSAGFTGNVADEVRQTTEGAKLYFELVNKQGGVFGRKIELESLDDGFDPLKTLENTQKLINEKNAFALFLYRGTPTTEAGLPLLAKAHIPLVAPVTGATSLHEPLNRYVFNVRARYREEVKMAVDQLSGMGLQRFAALVSDDSFGADALEGLKQSLIKHGLPEPIVAKYDRKSLFVGDAVSTILNAKPQAILLFCTAKACTSFIEEYRSSGGTQQLITLSNVASPGFIQDLGKNSRGLGMVQVFPNSANSTVPIVKELIAALKSHTELTNSSQLLEGFVSAKVLVEGLRRAGAAPTRDKLVTALESMGGADLGGVAMRYGPTSRNGSSFIELTVVGNSGQVLR